MSSSNLFSLLSSPSISSSLSSSSSTSPSPHPSQTQILSREDRIRSLFSTLCSTRSPSDILDISVSSSSLHPPSSPRESSPNSISSSPLLLPLSTLSIVLSRIFSLSFTVESLLPLLKSIDPKRIHWSENGISLDLFSSLLEAPESFVQIFAENSNYKNNNNSFSVISSVSSSIVSSSPVPSVHSPPSPSSPSSPSPFPSLSSPSPSSPFFLPSLSHSPRIASPPFLLKRQSSIAMARSGGSGGGEGGAVSGKLSSLNSHSLTFPPLSSTAIPSSSTIASSSSSSVSSSSTSEVSLFYDSLSSSSSSPSLPLTTLHSIFMDADPSLSPSMVESIILSVYNSGNGIGGESVGEKEKERGMGSPRSNGNIYSSLPSSASLMFPSSSSSLSSSAASPSPLLYDSPPASLARRGPSATSTASRNSVRRNKLVMGKNLFMLAGQS